MYDFLIVGAGLYGSVIARQLTDCGKKCLVIDRRPYVGGNCHTTRFDNIDVHMHGAHIFHTSNDVVWSYMNRFSSFNRFVNRVKAITDDGDVISLPINMSTFNKLWGVITPEQARSIIETKRVKIHDPTNLEEWILSQVGDEIYRKLIFGYTSKQWMRHPSELPSSIIKRLPIRYTWDDDYYDDKYQGIPTIGYTTLFKRMLDGIPVVLDVDFMSNVEGFEKEFDRIVYSGSIDELFEYSEGVLEYRSLRFVDDVYDHSDFQGNAVMNYVGIKTPWTRIIEHKHFIGLKDVNRTIVTREFPIKWTGIEERYYPIDDDRVNRSMYERYVSIMKEMKGDEKYFIGGRLGLYRYFDMDDIVELAINDSHRLLSVK